MENERGRQWLVAGTGHLVSLRLSQVRALFRKGLTVALDSLFVQRTTSRMVRELQPKPHRAQLHYLPVGEHLPVEVQEQLHREAARRSHPSTYSVKLNDLTNP